MMTPQLFYLIVGIIVVLYGRRLLMRRAIIHYDAGTVGRKVKGKENILLLDVRTSGERSRRHIRGSVHIPLHELKGRMRELEEFRDKEIICYCQSGNRSLSASHTLKRNGFRVANLSCGMSAWVGAE